MAFPLLTLIADVVAIIGGLLVAVFQFRVDPVLYGTSIVQLTTFDDYWSGLGKSVVFGFLVALTGCYQGLSFTGGSTELGRATMGTAVISGIVVLVADYMLPQVFALL